MIWEIVGAMILGAVVLAAVLEPLLRRRAVGSIVADMADPEETPKGIALAALREIEFDRATGKLSEADYEDLTRKYTATALAAMREEEGGGSAAIPRGAAAPDALEAMVAAKVRMIRDGAGRAGRADRALINQGLTGATGPTCPSCGPRPEADAVFCSSCGARLPTGLACPGCGAALPPGSRFCEVCGQKTAA